MLVTKWPLPYQQLEEGVVNTKPSKWTLDIIFFFKETFRCTWVALDQCWQGNGIWPFQTRPAINNPRNAFAPFFRWLPLSLNLSQSEFCYLSMTGMIVRLFVSLLILLIPVSGNIRFLRRRHASKLQQRQTEKDWQSETWFLRISTKATCSSLSPGQTNLSVGLESAGATINYYQVYFFLPISICQPNNDTVFLQPVSI